MTGTQDCASEPLKAEPQQELAPAEPAGLCHVVAKMTPFSDTMVAMVEPGCTLAEILGPNVSQTAHVVMGGVEVPRRMWEHVKPKPGVPVEVTLTPQGGGAGKVLRLVAVAVLMYYTAGILGGTYAGALTGASGGVATLGSAALAAGVSVAGMLAINALIPPPKPQMGPNSGAVFNSLNSITGTGNQVNPYGPIPCVVGTYRFTQHTRTYRRRRNRARKRAPFVHEAGHTLAAWLLGMGIVRVKASPAGAGSFTQTKRCLIEGTDAASVETFCKSRTPAQLTEIVLRQAVQAMAGPMAEGRAMGWGLTWRVLAEPGQRDPRDPNPTDLQAWSVLLNLLPPEDREHVALSCAHLGAYLLATYWPKVEAIADLLQTRGEITGADLVPVLGEPPEPESVLERAATLNLSHDGDMA